MKKFKKFKHIRKFNIFALFVTILILPFSAVFIQSCIMTENTQGADGAEKAEKSDSFESFSISKTLLEDMIAQYQSNIHLYDPPSLQGDKMVTELGNAIRDGKKVLAKLAELPISIDRNEDIEFEMENAVVRINKAAEQFKSFYLDTSNKTADANLIDKLYITGVKCAYDENSRTFFYTMGKTPDREFTFDFYIGNIDTKYDEPAYLSRSNVFCEIYDKNDKAMGYRFKPELNTEYILKTRTEKTMFDYKIIFTMLPIIQIDGIDRIGDNYKDCVISVTDPDFSYNLYGSIDKQINIFFESSAKIHVRGGISRWFPKKPYALKFVDEKGGNKDVKLFGMRKDSDWILDAMYIDKARMRNRVATDVWNDMDSPLYFMTDGMNPQTNGTRGVFVEVFINREYMGLYCFTEKIDRKQLQLQKNDEELKSVIYKGYTWDEPILCRQYWGYDNNWWTWGGFKQMYPRALSGGQIKWDPLAEFIDYAVNSSDAEFIRDIEKYIDIDNFVDYTILLCISFAYDNTGKNAFWSIYDITDEKLSKIFLTPWDLDATWGGSWNGDHIGATIVWMDSEREHDSYLFRRLILTNAAGFADKLRAKWDSLRGGVLSPESLAARFDGYFDLFDASGAWNRESRKWRECGLDLERERIYVRTWIKDRWNYIDDFIRNKLDTVGDFASSAGRRRR